MEVVSGRSQKSKKKQELKWRLGRRFGGVRAEEAVALKKGSRQTRGDMTCGQRKKGRECRGEGD